ncbi:hypothetical protein RJT34_16593 [Clitoria ternatea]|uniref:Uncharacterized protein n=1 Tax=Clitoria ternatea TaxID=43366 RepID=A0AAN9PCD5_CLITE
MAESSTEPHLQLAITKTIEVYELLKNAIAPHLSRAQEFVDPYQVCGHYQDLDPHQILVLASLFHVLLQAWLVLIVDQPILEYHS